MTGPRLNLIDVVARDYGATVDFYRLLGVELTGSSAGGDLCHAEARFGDMGMHVDDEPLARVYNSSWRRADQTRVVIGFAVDTRDDVDRHYAELTAAGHPAVQPPYDAFWGARYAIVADPDGNHVGLMSPIDAEKKQWPPTPAPEQ